MKVATVVVKCPICGESRKIRAFGVTGIVGIDPLMQKFRCESLHFKYEGDFPGGKETREICRTEFYVAPPPKYTEVK